MNTHKKFAEARPKFRLLKAETVEAALGPDRLPNDISLEVGRLMQCYLCQLRGAALDDGEAVSSFISFRPATAIEMAARQLTVGVLCDAIIGDGGRGIKRFWESRHAPLPEPARARFAPPVFLAPVRRLATG